jgi:DNA-binding GntR family transcriptional regulator
MKIKPLTYQITENLRDQIIQGKLKPGQRIMDTDIVSELDVSRTPIREALKILETEGLITIKPRKGAFVAEITSKDAWEVYTIIAVLCALAIPMVVNRTSEADIKKLKNIFQKMEETVKEESPDINKYLHFHLKFHDTIFQIAGNGRLRQIYNNMNNHIRGFGYITFSNLEYLRSSCQRHKKILESVEVKDKEQGKRLMYDHVIEGYENFCNMLGYPENIKEMGVSYQFFFNSRLFDFR